MTAEIGHFTLVLALAVALVQSTLPLAGAWTGNVAWMALGRSAALAQAALAVIAFAMLTVAFVGSGKFIKERPDVAERFVTALVEAARLMQGDQYLSKENVDAYLKHTTSTEAASISVMNLSILVMNQL